MISKADRARAMAYKKPMVKELNYGHIVERVYEIMEKCGDVQYISESDEELMADAFESDEEAYQFKMMFSELSADADRTYEKLSEHVVEEEFFDKWFVCMKTGDDFGGYMAYDSYEQDYVDLDIDWIAEKEATSSIKRLTKDEIISNAYFCFRVYTAWQSLEQRYILLESAMNTLLEKNISFLKSIKEIDRLYDLLMDSDSTEHQRRFDKLVSSMPEEVWIQ